MKKLTAADPESRSADLIAENIERLRELFPELVTEGPEGASVNVDVLGQLIGEQPDNEADERFGLIWHGKGEARKFSLVSSTGTLRPCPADSADWGTTSNLVIEGDNLEVMKLLQKSYASRVKMIYIDPPYNTGEDFIYPDDFQHSIENYFSLTGQLQDGKRTTSEVEAGGRFHTLWLNMMYPRLKLARGLLQDDGIIFISIDDAELSNLILIGREIFGEENFIGVFVWEKRTNRENRKMISSRHDYVACFCRNRLKGKDIIGQLPMNEAALSRYKNPDDDPRGPWKSDPATAQAGHGTKGQFYVLTAPNGNTHELPSGRCWAYTKPVMQEAIEDGRIWFGRDGNGVPRIKTYLNAKDRGLTVESIFFAAETSTNEGAKNALKELFDGKAVFDTPKPTELIERMIEVSAPDGIVLDFFAGSGSTGHAVMSKNADDGGNRRFILVQLPEALDPENKDQRVAANFCKDLGKPLSISELTKERLRRAASRIRRESPMFSGDLGFRVFRLDSTNIREWSPRRDSLPETLEESVEHLKSDRAEQDILFELLLKLGLDLCISIETVDLGGKQVHAVGGGVLIACLSTSISVKEVEELGLGIANWRSQLDPAGDTTCVFRDSAFGNDVSKTNMAAILNQNGISNVRSI